MLAVVSQHDSVANHFCEDACGCDGHAARVTADDGIVWHGQILCGEPIHEGMRGFRQLRKSGSHRHVGGPENVVAVNGIRLDPGHGPPYARIACEELVEVLPPRGSQFF